MTMRERECASRSVYKFRLTSHIFYCYARCLKKYFLHTNTHKQSLQEQQQQRATCKPPHKRKLNHTKDTRETIRNTASICIGRHPDSNCFATHSISSFSIHNAYTFYLFATRIYSHRKMFTSVGELVSFFSFLFFFLLRSVEKGTPKRKRKWWKICKHIGLHRELRCSERDSSTF